MPRQASKTARLMAFVKDRPNVLLSALVFEQFGRLAWRTEISRARKRFHAAQDGTIENVPVYHGPTAGCRCKCERYWEESFYRYVPAGEPAAPSVGHDLNGFSLR